ncbi:DoxX family protein [Patescibacteria group bacterium]|nr:DoxX family protein [Patescibacteria group bacterium]
MMWSKMCGDKARCKDAALLILRLAAGGIFIFHGYGKLFGDAPGMQAFTGMVAGLGFPAPVVFAYLAALSEFFGGIALVLGVGTPIAAAFLSIVMLVALFAVKKFNFPAADVDLTLLAMVVALGMMGSGKYALMRSSCCAGQSSCCKMSPEEKETPQMKM